jgi:hypothetical protein
VLEERLKRYFLQASGLRNLTVSQR